MSRTTMFESTENYVIFIYGAPFITLWPCIFMYIYIYIYKYIYTYIYIYIYIYFFIATFFFLHKGGVSRVQHY